MTEDIVICPLENGVSSSSGEKYVPYLKLEHTLEPRNLGWNEICPFILRC